MVRARDARREILLDVAGGSESSETEDEVITRGPGGKARQKDSMQQEWWRKEVK